LGLSDIDVNGDGIADRADIGMLLEQIHGMTP